MDFLALAANRESCRKYLDTPVERSKIAQCIEAARLGPSACNSQPYRFVVVDDALKVKEMADYLHMGKFNEFTRHTPAFIVITDNTQVLLGNGKGQVYADKMLHIDIGIASQNICLAATSMGLGTCIMGMFKEAEIKKMLNIPEDRRIGLVIAIGYPVYPTARPKVRRAIDDILSYNQY